jgi:hypothetical protein
MQSFTTQKKCIVISLICFLVIPVLSPLDDCSELQDETEDTHVFVRYPDTIKEDAYDLHIEYNRNPDGGLKVKTEFPPKSDGEIKETKIDNNKVTFFGYFPANSKITVTATHIGNKQIRVKKYWWTNEDKKRTGPEIPVLHGEIQIPKVDVEWATKWMVVKKPPGYIQHKTSYKNNVKDVKVEKKSYGPSWAKIRLKFTMEKPGPGECIVFVDPPDEIFEIDYEIEFDETAPSVQISKPRDGIYLDNSLLIPIPAMTIVLGSVDIEIEATDNLLMDRVEIYIDEQLKFNDTEAPYAWEWSESSFGVYSVKAVAYDNATNWAIDELNVWKFF